MEKYSTESPVKIRGAGIKGLALAYFLRKRGIPSVIYEKSERAGGWIQTIEKEGFLFETGPRSFRGHPVLLEMIRDLGLEDQLIKPNVKKRYLYHKGTLVSVSRFLPRLLPALMRDALLPKCHSEMSVKDYFSYRLGSFCTSTLIDPLCSGIFAGDIEKLSAQGCFPAMTRKGSILSSQWHEPRMEIFGFKKGMQTWVEAIQKGQDIRYKTHVENPDYDCSPNPTYTYSSVVSINFGWKEAVLNLPGFGYLVAQKEKQTILGTIFNSDRTLSVMMGGAHRPEMIDMSDEQLLRLAKEALASHLNITKPPTAYHLHRARDAIPQPLVGQAVKGVGLSGAILQAYEFVK